MRTYLFDFDGTLVDSMPTYTATMLHILEEYHIDYNNDIVEIITPLGYDGTAKYFISLGVPAMQDDLVIQMKKQAVQEYTHHIPAKNNVIQVLKQLKSHGANLNILTASPHIMLDPCLKRLGIFDLFSNIWSCDDFGITKSNPQIYIEASQKIGVPAEDILFVDDNYNANVTAKAAGMKVCGIYDESSKECADRIKGVTDYYIHDFSELLFLE